jgi:hypothetical protein
MIKKLQHLIPACAMAAVMIGGTTSAYAGLLGHDFTADYIFQADGTVVTALGTAVAGPGVEFNYFGALPIDLTDDQITFTFLLDGDFQDASFHGFRIRDVDGSAGITGVSLALVTGIPGFDAGNVSLSGNDILLNFTDGGIGLDPGLFASVVLNVTFGPLVVPRGPRLRAAEAQSCVAATSRPEERASKQVRLLQRFVAGARCHRPAGP